MRSSENWGKWRPLRCVLCCWVQGVQKWLKRSPYSWSLPLVEAGKDNFSFSRVSVKIEVSAEETPISPGAEVTFELSLKRRQGMVSSGGKGVSGWGNGIHETLQGWKYMWCIRRDYKEFGCQIWALKRVLDTWLTLKCWFNKGSTEHEVVEMNPKPFMGVSGRWFSVIHT